MEFFENECGVKFIDMETGKSALDSLRKYEKQTNKDKLCSNCKYILKGDGKFIHISDNICGNIDSIHATEFRSLNATCELWETV
jgi:hypothetical protein